MGQFMDELSQPEVYETLDLVIKENGVGMQKRIRTKHQNSG